MERARKKYGLKKKIYKKRYIKNIRNNFRPKLTQTEALTPARLEYVLYVQCINSSANIVNTAGTNYWALAGDMSTSSTWQILAADYLRYKITGLSIRVAPLANGGDIGGGVSNYPIAIGFYPNFSGSNVSTADVLSKDDSYRAEPNVNIVQQKYWSFPDKYFEAGGTGFGVWTPTSSIGSQVGQLSLGYHNPFLNYTVTKLLYMIRVCVYVKFSTRRA